MAASWSESISTVVRHTPIPGFIQQSALDCFINVDGETLV